MKNASLFYALALFLVSCGGSTSEEQYGDKVTLLPCDTISFPIDENTTYESRAMFQFEDDGREYLSFRTYENKGNHIHIFDSFCAAVTLCSLCHLDIRLHLP